MIFKTADTVTSCGCSTESKAPSVCPECHKAGIKVKAVTIRSQLKKEPLGNMRASADAFSFCTEPGCDTVYYADNGKEAFGQADVKSKVALKNDDPRTPLCYCKKLLKKDVLQMIENREPGIAAKVRTIISEGKSFCEKSNPRGVCCTEDVKAYLSDRGISWEEPRISLFSSTPPSSCC